MRGQVIQPGFQRCGIETFNGLSDLSVTQTALPVEEPRVYGFSCQRVTKKEPVPGLFDHDASGDQLLHQFKQRRLVEAGQGAQEIEVEAAPRDGCHRKDVSSRVTEHDQSLLNGIMDAARNVWMVQP